MSINTLPTRIPRYIGLNSDTKPTIALHPEPLPEPVPGSTFLEYDTDAMYITYDGTNWVQFDQLVKLVAGTADLGIVGHNITGIANGRKVVAAAATAEALAASTAAKVVIITAETDNTGIIVVGGSAVVEALATRQGTPLSAGESVTLQVDNLVDVYLDTTVNGDGVTYTYLTQ